MSISNHNGGEQDDYLYIFYHQNRTGGTTITTHLRRFLKEETLFLYKNDNPDLAFKKGVEDYLEKMPPDQKNKIRVIMGHQVYYGIHRFFNREARYITVLREPLSRLISMYNHRSGMAQLGRDRKAAGAEEGHGEILTFDEFVKTNDYHTIFSNLIDHDFIDEPELNQIKRQKNLDWIIDKILSKFYFIGIAEKSKKDFLFLSHLFNVNGNLVSVNRSKKFIRQKEYFATNKPEFLNSEIDEIFYRRGLKSNTDFKIKNMEFEKIIRRMETEKIFSPIAKLRQVIENQRHSSQLFWRILVASKDLLWRITKAKLAIVWIWPPHPTKTDPRHDENIQISRYYIEKFLKRNSHHIQGTILEIGDNRYTKKFGRNVKISDVLDCEPKNSQANIRADLTKAESMPRNKYDCIILTQVLEYIIDYEAAIKNICEALKPNGVLLCTVPFLEKIYDSDGPDYWRFSPVAARHIFQKYFTNGSLKIESYGNLLSAVCFLKKTDWQKINQKKLDENHDKYPVVICVKVTK